jgi:acetyl-CoA acetyltransferase
MNDELLERVDTITFAALHLVNEALLDAQIDGLDADDVATVNMNVAAQIAGYITASVAHYTGIASSELLAKLCDTIPHAFNEGANLIKRSGARPN